MRDKVRFSASVLCLLATAILLTIYLAWLLYSIEISYFNLSDKVYLKSETIQYNFNILMNYLTNPFSQKLAMPDFRSSEAGLHHFQAVKYLFHLAQAIFLVTLPALIFFIKKVVKKGFLSLYRRAFLVISILPLVFAGLAFMIGFNNFFTLFHPWMTATKRSKPAPVSMFLCGNSLYSLRGSAGSALNCDKTMFQISM